MLKIKVQDSTHQFISVIAKYLCIFGYIGAVGYFGYSMVTNYREATAILSDSVTVDAELSLDDVVYKTSKRGRTTETYHFSYYYDANGQDFEKSFTSSGSTNADKYLESETIQIAYAKSNPQLSGKVDQLEKNSSISSLLWRGLLAIFGLMFLAGVVYGLITAVLFINKDQLESDD